MAKRSVTSGARRTASAKSRSSWLSRLPIYLKALGPGIVTGAADDDPSGIATYSQVGAQFGFGMLWVMLFSYPLMCGIQEISGDRSVEFTGRRHCRQPFAVSTTRSCSISFVGLMVIANVINLGADIGAMGAALKLLIGGPALVYARSALD